MITFKTYQEVKLFPEIHELVIKILPPDMEDLETERFDWMLGGDVHFMETVIDMMTVPGTCAEVNLINDNTEHEYDAQWVFFKNNLPVYAAVYTVTNDAGGPVYLFSLELLKSFRKGLDKVLTNLDNNRIDLC